MPYNTAGIKSKSFESYGFFMSRTWLFKIKFVLYMNKVTIYRIIIIYCKYIPYVCTVHIVSYRKIHATYIKIYCV